MHDYSSLIDASRGLLVEAVALAKDSHQAFVVMGGWSPLLLNSDRPVAHPGTRDVDLLFELGATTGQLRDMVDRLLAAGYLSSAKHEFQLLRILRVADRELVFNVDLLHPLEAVKAPLRNADLFVEHIDLGIPLSTGLPARLMGKSIATPDAAFILEDGRFVNHEVEAVAPDGAHVTVEVPVVDELGLIVSKLKSMTSIKRPRDAFDIFLAITQARDSDALVAHGQELVERNDRIAAVLFDTLATFNEDAFDECANTYLDPDPEREPSAVFREFLEAIGVRQDA